MANYIFDRTNKHQDQYNLSFQNIFMSELINYICGRVFLFRENYSFFCSSDDRAMLALFSQLLLGTVWFSEVRHDLEQRPEIIPRFGWWVRAEAKRKQGKNTWPEPLIMHGKLEILAHALPWHVVV
jgi:hypothetical protein